MARGLDRVDSVGGKLIARFWGTLLGIVAVLVLLPMLVSAVRNEAWITGGVVLLVTAAVAALIRYLFSRNRRLSDFE
ncbi:MAG: hypothetical protein HKN91_12470 [Acidimicrobiia bacterium]|nr:hypothetical protein [Acidimicrobiia bacterium]